MTDTRHKVLFLNHSSEIGGGELSLFDITRTFPNSEVVLLSSGPFLEKLRATDIPVEVIEGGTVLDVRRDDGPIRLIAIGPALVALIARLARKARSADILYANSQKAFVTGALTKAFTRRPLIWHLRDLLTPDHFSSPMRWGTVALANHFANLVIANSQATAEAFRAAGGKTRVEVVHSCIDPTRFDVAPAQLPETTLRGGPILGVFSRLASWKGQHIAVQALADLPDHQLVLVGGALFGEEAYEVQVRQLADRLGVADRVHYMGFRNDSPALMHAVDVVIHSSTSPEPFGRVIVEGMLAGKPVIATAAGGALEIIDNGENGLLVPPGDAKALAEAIRGLSSKPDRARELAEKGRQHALAKFTVAASNAQIKALVTSLGCTSR